jgi:hypothetical protein
MEEKDMSKAEIELMLLKNQIEFDKTQNDAKNKNVADGHAWTVGMVALVIVILFGVLLGW